MDIPDAVTGLKLSDTGNNRLALSWDAVDATGIHEGFVDTENVVYTIYAPDGTEIDKSDRIYLHLERSADSHRRTARPCILQSCSFHIRRRKRAL